MVIGPVGTGKSTLIKALREENCHTETVQKEAGARQREDCASAAYVVCTQASNRSGNDADALFQQSLTVKTQMILYEGSMIDTPGEYVQIPRFYSALLVTSLEAGVVLMVCSATNPILSFPPAFAGMFSRPVVGVVTKIDLPGADPKGAESVLKQAGVTEPVFFVSAITGAGLDVLRKYLLGLPVR